MLPARRFSMGTRHTCVALAALIPGLLATSAAFAQGQGAPVSDGRPPRAKAEIQYTSQQALEKGITLARISNGMTVLVQENHSAPVATVRCYIHNTGSAY